ncbi:alpha/beta fold hydrolase [Candidatus Daviesbacteria bacterium]|nr:alpha/beta fold hydrolase [Candidatus Daviesbacteria bacterium]
MKNALILHGAGNDHTGNWFPWLKKELGQQGYKVWVPDLPNSEAPVLKDWLEAIFKSDWVFDEDSIIVGHSAGATLILRILEKLPKAVKINKAILVAGFIFLGKHPEYFKYKESILEKPFDFKKIKASAKHFYFIHSDNDKYDCGVENGEILKEKLGGKLIIMKGQKHFSSGDPGGEKYFRFDELLNYID